MRRTPALAALAGTLALGVAGMAAQASSPTSAFGAPYGGFAAYHAAALATLGKTEPQNHSIAYSGPKLVLSEAYMGRNAAEPTLGVQPNGTIFTVAAAFDALPAGSPKNEPRTMVMRSTDGGRSFQVDQPNLLGVNSQNVSTDPYMYVEPTTGRVFDLDLQGLNGAHLSYSSDGGKTWTESLLGTAGVNDHQTLVAGPAPEGGAILPLTDPTFQKILYYCVNGVAAGSCVRSFDGGRTFTQADQTGYEAVNPGYLANFDSNHNEGICGSLHGHAVTDRWGRLFIPRGYCSLPMLAISTDAAVTFTDVQVANIRMDGEQASVAADSQGNLYYVFYDATYHLPFLTISRDHGRTWGTPRMIAPPGVHEVDFPTIDVGDPGKIAITFPGTTSTGGGPTNSTGGRPDKTRPWNSYVVVSTNALSGNPLFLSNIANPKGDPVARGDCAGRCGRMYDFLDVVSAPGDQGRVFATAVDTCTTMNSCSTRRLDGVNTDNTVGNEVAYDYGASGDMKGVVIREVSGPALRGDRPWITSDTRR